MLFEVEHREMVNVDLVLALKQEFVLRRGNIVPFAANLHRRLVKKRAHDLKVGFSYFYFFIENFSEFVD